MNPLEVPEFNTERLCLRGLRPSDIPAYQRHFVDYEVIRHLSAKVPWPYPQDGVRDYVMHELLPKQGNNYWCWGLCLHTQPSEVIGTVNLWRPGTPENRGFWLGKAFWGRGLMTEAVHPVMRYAFEQLGFDKLILNNAQGNDRSRRIKEKTGARLVDVVPAQFVDAAYSHSELWELTKAAWHQWLQIHEDRAPWKA